MHANLPAIVKFVPLLIFCLFLSLGYGAVDTFPRNYVCPLRGHLLGFNAILIWHNLVFFYFIFNKNLCLIYH